ncbi:MAG TPA: SURF1 family protein [Acidimicrobiales bacterium]
MRSLLTPRWLLSHVLVVALVVLMVNLGLWQLRRLDERRAANAAVEAALARPVEDVGAVVDAGAPFGDVDGVVWRRVTATGTYALDEQVLVRSRSYQGNPGSWVLTPLVLDDGTAVAVNRGWVPIGEEGPEGPPPPESAPPTGRVTVTGVLQATQERGRFGPTDPAEGRLVTLSRLDLGRLQQQVDEDLYPVALQLEASEPAQAGGLPVPVPLPETGDEGPHLGYAVQWFVFSTIAAVGYVVILRRQRAERAGRDERVPDWVS